jgi:hypothetical protein
MTRILVRKDAAGVGLITRAGNQARGGRRLGGARVKHHAEKLEEEIRECYRHAEDCARKAAAQTDPKRKENFFELERRWLFLARSWEFAERLTDFSDEAKRKEDELSEV